MTPAELRELAGLNEPSKNEINRKWADSQMDNSLVEKFDESKLVVLPTNEYENVARRLNSMLNTTSIKIERIN